VKKQLAIQGTVYKTKNQAKGRAKNGRAEYKQFTGKELFLLQIWLVKSSLNISDFLT
jgi:hypothetical protein